MATVWKHLSYAWKRLIGDATHALEEIGNWWLPKATIVIPAFNEEKTIRKVVQIALSTPHVGEVIVVNDGSTDQTLEKIKDLPVKTITHRTNYGKGRAIKTGIHNATHNDILFLDADLENITKEKIQKLLQPLLEDEADFVKAGFSLKRGRVTEIAVKPMMRILYPGNEFSQPISGQFGAKKQFLKQTQIVDRWGIDISLLLDAIKHNQRILEIDIGEVMHKARTTEEKAEMSQQVMETMLKKAGLIANQYPNIIFSEHALYDSHLQPRPRAKEIVQHLFKRRYHITILQYHNNKNMEPFENTQVIPLHPEWTEQRTLETIETMLAATPFSLVHSIFVAANPLEKSAFKKAGYRISYNRNPELQAMSQQHIHNLSELALVE